MCQQLGEAVTGPITIAASGNPAGVTANNAICNRTDCPSYGKWWCPFTGW